MEKYLKIKTYLHLYNDILCITLYTEHTQINFHSKDVQCNPNHNSNLNPYHQGGVDVLGVAIGDMHERFLVEFRVRVDVYQFIICCLLLVYWLQTCNVGPCQVTCATTYMAVHESYFQHFLYLYLYLYSVLYKIYLKKYNVIFKISLKF